MGSEESTWTIRLLGFPGVGRTGAIKGIQESFRVSAKKAEWFFERMPVKVRSKATHREAQQFAAVLLRLGAEVAVIDNISGRRKVLSPEAVGGKEGFGRVESRLLSLDSSIPGKEAQSDAVPEASPVESSEFEAATEGQPNSIRTTSDIFSADDPLALAFADPDTDSFESDGLDILDQAAHALHDDSLFGPDDSVADLESTAVPGPTPTEGVAKSPKPEKSEAAANAADLFDFDPDKKSKKKAHAVSSGFGSSSGGTSDHFSTGGGSDGDKPTKREYTPLFGVDAFKGDDSGGLLGPSIFDEDDDDEDYGVETELSVPGGEASDPLGVLQDDEGEESSEFLAVTDDSEILDTFPEEGLTTGPIRARTSEPEHVRDQADDSMQLEHTAHQEDDDGAERGPSHSALSLDSKVCPKCGVEQPAGDSCQRCGHSYEGEGGAKHTSDDNGPSLPAPVTRGPSDQPEESDSANCVSCGRRLPKQLRACPRCGAQQEEQENTACSNCGGELALQLMPTNERVAALLFLSVQVLSFGAGFLALGSISAAVASLCAVNAVVIVVILAKTSIKCRQCERRFPQGDLSNKQREAVKSSIASLRAVLGGVILFGCIAAALTDTGSEPVEVELGVVHLEDGALTHHLVSGGVFEFGFANYFKDIEPVTELVHSAVGDLTTVGYRARSDDDTAEMWYISAEPTEGTPPEALAEHFSSATMILLARMGATVDGSRGRALGSLSGSRFQILGVGNQAGLADAFTLPDGYVLVGYLSTDSSEASLEVGQGLLELLSYVPASDEPGL